MKFINDSAIEHLALRVIDRTLPKAEWSHQAHFAFALWLLRMRPDLATADGARRLITHYNEASGTKNTENSGYHHTITRASMAAAANHLGDHPDHHPLHAVLISLIASPMGRPDWLLLYWRRETLFSVDARLAWVEPDIAPLPFQV